MHNKVLTETVERLIEEGKAVIATKSPLEYFGFVINGAALEKWLSGCRNLMRLLGNVASSFNENFKASSEYSGLERAEKMLAALDAIRESLQHGLLVEMENLISAEIFDDLLGQADYLESEGYFLAAGVLGRAVLEEHLRNWCGTAGCMPAKAKPTLSDFNMALYTTAKAYNVSVMKHVEAMAAVGNDAAHNKPELTREAVTRLLRDLREFLGKWSG